MSTPGHGTYFYQFGPFQVDVINRQLLRDGIPVPLAPKVLDALFVLVENSGRVLKKEDLMNYLWPDCFVEESSLTQIIFQLRKALGESAARQQYIETIPKRGYRFIAEIKMVNGELEDGFTQLNGINDIFQEDRDRIDKDSRVNGKEAVVAVRQELANIAPHSQPSVELTPAPTIEPVAGHRWKKVAFATAALLVVTAGAYSFNYIFRNTPLIGRSNAPFKKVPQIRMLTTSGRAQQPALSPDGNYLAYVQEEAGRQSIWMRQMNSTSDVQVVPPSDVDYRGMTFSPNSSYIYYVALEKDPLKSTLYQVPVLGGTSRMVLDRVDSTITFSPDGKRFAFVRITAAQNESFLITANADGSGEQQLAARKKPEIFSVRGPAWSPDGKTIATPAGWDKPGEFFMNVVTINVANGSIATLGSQTWDGVGRAAWLKDGSGVVVSAWHHEWPVYANQLWYLSYPDGEISRVTNDQSSHEGTNIAAQTDELVAGQSTRISRLWVAPNGDTSRAHLIRSGYGDNYSEYFGLSWTPQGRLIYGSHASGSADIWVMDADGSNQKQLTYDTRREVSPVITSDGRYIVFVSIRSRQSSYLRRMDADGNNPIQLTRGKIDDNPSLSPDGRWVVYSSYDDSGKQTLWNVSIDGGEPKQLTHHTTLFPSVSPDGKLIACEIRDEKINRMFAAIFPFEGGEPIKVFDQMPAPAWGLLRWTPDGRALTYIVTKDGVSNIWLQPVDGGRPKQLTHFNEDQIFRLAWSHDGKNLAYDRGVTIKNIIHLSDFR
ncbi:MAG: winged helix-turn-helix domain-containing protein [Acidobacteria bacterium]|nr:winged helix-turn-helix domain-containing protein [Acidobacteriota bacterium]